MPRPSAPVTANFPADAIVFAAGAAIFHIATARVVLCRSTLGGGWFLPKGRRDAGEELGVTAVREGFEESGYRCRLVPLPVRHCQPRGLGDERRYFAEPFWTQLVPVSRSRQYIVCWYAAETLNEELERQTGEAGRFAVAEAWEEGFTVERRREMDRRGGEIYQPVKHEGTGVNEEEATYESYLFTVDEAMRLLRGTIMADVVRQAWDAIELREKMELKTAAHEETNA